MVQSFTIIYVHSRSLSRMIELIDNNIKPEVHRKLKSQTIQITFQKFRKDIFLENFQFCIDLGRKETTLRRPMFSTMVNHS